jgi:hypothetical protein
VARVEADVAEAVNDQGVREQQPLLGARPRQVDDLELRRVHRFAGVGELGAQGQLRRDRREDVAAVERGRHRFEPVRRARHIRRELDAAAALPRQAEQAVVGTYQDAPVRSAQRDRTPLGPHLGVDDGDVHADRHVGQRVAQHERAVAHRVAADAVRDVHDVDVGIDRADHAVADADEVVVAPVVGEQRDDHGRTSSTIARTRPSMSCRSAST